ncbi:hypothetical protein [Acinetobacter sp. IK40]|uniref:hypothetical protein n=1 Tax=Acinetobacter sp. IK40 TaxID=2928897 RepID=UPI002D1F55C1|nr:hypothetical protein [Acinetobacter sp. IK40]MEB3790105.1 hypothetical protein [Acinetobacter sp. IK40]
MNIENLENEIQSWIAVKSFAVEDAHPQLPIIDANELAEMLSSVFKKLEGCVVVPVEPTEAMYQAYEKHSVAPMSTLSKTGYKAMVEAARGGNE